MILHFFRLHKHGFRTDAVFLRLAALSFEKVRKITTVLLCKPLKKQKERW